MAARETDRADRIAFGIIAGMSGVLGLLAIAGGVWRTVALAAGNGPVELLAGGDLPGAEAGRITTATVTSDTVGEVSQGLLVAGSGIGLVITVAIYAAIVAFLTMSARGTPFHRFLFPVVLTTGTLMSAGGVLSASLDGFGRMIAGGELGEPYETAFELHLGPWAFGFVVLVAAYVIRTGRRLQRETEGLV